MQNVEVVPYNKSWADIFESLVQSISQVLGKNCLTVHHIGSTAVPGLIAKPVIDIIVVVKDILNIVSDLEKSGYMYKGEINIPFRYYFTKKSDSIKIHLHVYEEGNSEIHLNLLFRDYLRKSPQLCEEYAALKKNLVNQKSSCKKGNLRFSNYTLGKDIFIKKVLEQSGFNEFCIRFCTHHDEWEIYHRIRKEQLFDLAGIQYDPKHPDITDPNHFHFVFYKGTKIIGAAHLEFLSLNEAALRSFAIDASCQNQGFGGEFLILIEKWLKSKGKIILRLHANKKALPFYKRLGYEEMIFHDLNRVSMAAMTIDMGKRL